MLKEVFFLYILLFFIIFFKEIYNKQIADGTNIRIKIQPSCAYWNQKICKVPQTMWHLIPDKFLILLPFSIKSNQIGFEELLLSLNCNYSRILFKSEAKVLCVLRKRIPIIRDFFDWISFDQIFRWNFFRNICSSLKVSTQCIECQTLSNAPLNALVQLLKSNKI